MSKTESFEFLNELALAFRSGETHPRPGNVPVLEGIRTVLAHLQSTGRLVPAGGMALTAEQVEDVRTVLGLKGSQDIKVVLDAQVRLRAMFPATEPAEDGWGDVNPNDPQGRTYRETAEEYYSTPAEPAEEETKAERCPSEIEGWGCSLTSGHDGDHTAHDQDGPAYVWPASSPVVPAPNEPVYVNVPTWQEVPEGITYHPEGRPEGFVNRGGQPYYLGMSKPLSATFEQLEDFMRPQGPFYFVPAPTETGPWQTWQEVPDGVKYKGHTESGKLTVATWVNRGGRRDVRKPSLQIVEHGDYADYEMHNFAPFVAAEEG